MLGWVLNTPLQFSILMGKVKEAFCIDLITAIYVMLFVIYATLRWTFHKAEPNQNIKVD